MCGYDNGGDISPNAWEATAQTLALCLQGLSSVGATSMTPRMLEAAVRALRNQPWEIMESQWSSCPHLGVSQPRGASLN